VSNIVSRKHAHSPTPEPSSESSGSPEAEESTDPLVVPDACLACGKEKVTHLTVPCRHPCLCRACAMKMATGGRCKVVLLAILDLNSRCVEECLWN
jgi:hypothetical protein